MRRSIASTMRIAADENDAMSDAGVVEEEVKDLPPASAPSEAALEMRQRGATGDVFATLAEASRPDLVASIRPLDARARARDRIAETRAPAEADIELIEVDKMTWHTRMSPLYHQDSNWHSLIERWLAELRMVRSAAARAKLRRLRASVAKVRSAFALPVRLLLVYRAWRAARRMRHDEWKCALVSVLPTRVVKEREREQLLLRALRSPATRFLYTNVRMV